MDRYVREHGFFVLLVVGIVLLAIGVTSQPLAILPGAVLTLVGGIARPIEEIVIKEGRLKWQREVIEKVAEKLQRRVEDSLTIEESVAAEVIRGEGEIRTKAPSVSGVGVVVTPEPARLRITTYPPTVIVRPQSPDEFADTLFEQIIEPAFIASEEHGNAPTLEQSEPEPNAEGQAE